MRKEIKLVRRNHSWITVEPLSWRDSGGQLCKDTQGLCRDTFDEYFEVPDDVDEIRLVVSTRPMGANAYKMKFDTDGEDFLLLNDATENWEWVTVDPGFDYFFMTHFPRNQAYVGVEYD